MKGQKKHVLFVIKLHYVIYCERDTIGDASYKVVSWQRTLVTLHDREVISLRSLKKLMHK